MPTAHSVLFGVLVEGLSTNPDYKPNIHPLLPGVSKGMAAWKSFFKYKNEGYGDLKESYCDKIKAEGRYDPLFNHLFVDENSTRAEYNPLYYDRVYREEMYPNILPS